MNKEMILLYVNVWQVEAGRRLASLRKAQLAGNSLDVAWFMIKVKSANRMAAKYRRQLKEVTSAN